MLVIISSLFRHNEQTKRFKTWPRVCGITHCLGRDAFLPLYAIIRLRLQQELSRWLRHTNKIIVKMLRSNRLLLEVGTDIWPDYKE